MALICLLSLLVTTVEASTSVKFVRVVRAEACNSLLVLPAYEHLERGEKSKAALELIQLEQLECLGSDEETLNAVLALIEGFHESFAVTAGLRDLVVIPVVGGKNNGPSVSLELVRAGLARPNSKALEKYFEAEAEARREGRGWWSTPRAARDVASTSPEE